MLEVFLMKHENVWTRNAMFFAICLFIFFLSWTVFSVADALVSGGVGILIKVWVGA